jgi:hypothetical protein
MNLFASFFEWFRDLRRRSFAAGQEASALEYRAVLQAEVLDAQVTGYRKAAECLALAREGLASTDAIEREIADAFREGVREVNQLGRSLMNGPTPMTDAERREALEVPFDDGSTQSGSDSSNRSVNGPSSRARIGFDSEIGSAFSSTRPATPSEPPKRPRGRPRKPQNGTPLNGEAGNPTRPRDVPPVDPAAP